MIIIRTHRSQYYEDCFPAQYLGYTLMILAETYQGREFLNKTMEHETMTAIYTMVGSRDDRDAIMAICLLKSFLQENGIRLVNEEECYSR